MEFTGERLIPGKVEADLFNEHLARYLYARELVNGKRVLDLGCGSGYGSRKLAESARLVFGVDVSPEAIEYSRLNFSGTNISFVAGDGTSLPFQNHSFDTVVCFEVIEHLFNQQALLEEAARVLSPGGFLMISTPNRIFYTEERQEINPFHTREFSQEEFSSFLYETFPTVQLLFQNHQEIIYLGNPRLGGEGFLHLEDKDPKAITHCNFFIAFCGREAADLPRLGNFAFVPSAANLLREQRLYIDNLEQRVSGKDEKILQLQEDYEERTQWAKKLDAEVIDRDRLITALQGEVEEKAAWGIKQKEEIQSRDDTIRELQREFDERTQWALQLNAELKTCQSQLNDIQTRRVYKLAAKLRLLPRY